MGSGAPNQDATGLPTCTPQNSNPNHTQYPATMISAARGLAARRGQSTGIGAVQMNDQAPKDSRGDEQARRQLQAMLEQASREALHEYAQQAQQAQQGMGASQVQNGGEYQLAKNGMMLNENGQWVQLDVGGHTATPQYHQQGFGVPQNEGQDFISNDRLMIGSHSCLTQSGVGQRNGTQQFLRQQKPSQQGFGIPPKRSSAGGHQAVQKRTTSTHKRRRTRVSAPVNTTTQQTIHQHHSYQQDFGVPRNTTEVQVAQNGRSPAPQSSYQVPDQSPQKDLQGRTLQSKGLSEEGTRSHVVKYETEDNGQDQNIQIHEQNNTDPQTLIKGEIGNGEDTPSKRIALNSMPSSETKAVRDAANASFEAHFNSAPSIPNWPQPKHAGGRVAPSSDRSKTICILATDPHPSPAPKKLIPANKNTFLVDWDLAFFYSPLLTFFFTLAENTYLTPYPLQVHFPTTAYLLTHWIYTQTIYPRPALATVPTSDSQTQLVDLWLVGESLQIPKLQNHALRELVRLRNESKIMSIDAVKLLYNNSNDDCLLRGFFVWQYATRLSVKSVLEKEAEALYPNRLLLEWIVLLDGLSRGGKEGLDTWTVDKFYVEEKIVGWPFGKA